MIYLDNAATSFHKPGSVYQAVHSAMLTAASPGRGGHALSLRAADLVYQCREEAAALFHMSDLTRVVFTSNASHALNIAIRTLARPGMRVLISGYEHNAVTRPLRAIGTEARVFGKRLFDPESLLEEFRKELDGVELVVCTHVSNVFGYVLPIAEIAQLCRERNIPLVIDASQSAGILDLDMDRLGAQFIAMPGHKSLFGPQGTGLLLCGNSMPEPLIWGGTGSDSREPLMPSYLPERLEAGTMNVPGIAGLLAGLRYVRSLGTDRIMNYERDILSDLRGLLEEMPRLRLFVGPPDLQSGILSFTVDGMDSETACSLLSERGIAVRGGLHCAPLAHQSAGTLDQGTVRVILSPFVDRTQIQAFAKIMKEIF